MSEASKTYRLRQICPSEEEQQPNGRKKARVIYNYRRAADDELNLNIGDTVTIVEKNLADKGWWKVI